MRGLPVTENGWGVKRVMVPSKEIGPLFICRKKIATPANSIATIICSH